MKPFKDQKIIFIILVTLVTATPLLAAERFVTYIDQNNISYDRALIDTVTGLVWQKCSGTEPQDIINGDNSANGSCGNAITYTWQNALKYCTNLGLAGKEWRLPSINELKTIVDRGRSAAPYVYTDFEDGTYSGNYWSSTTDPATGGGYALSIDFGNLGIVPDNLPPPGHKRNNSYYVRCVAGPESDP